MQPFLIQRLGSLRINRFGKGLARSMLRTAAIRGDRAASLPAARERWSRATMRGLELCRQGLAPARNQ